MREDARDSLLARESATHREYGSMMEDYEHAKNGNKPGDTGATTSLEELSPEARVAADREHDLTFLEAVAKYPTAIAWAMFFSLGVIMYVCS
jgi:hypothetical protein